MRPCPVSTSPGSERRRRADPPRRCGPWGGGAAIDAEPLRGVLARVEPAAVVLGGSSWNTVAALAHVGAAPRPAHPGLAGLWRLSSS
ncbi:hypothetical protein [Dactylosporangium sp. CA-233914]|uniref:hypothetical protein n=1 Tax=Dactylosporangium sp. CA-233914 TaxID=3239934 RepID=UPI003D926F71